MIHTSSTYFWYDTCLVSGMIHFYDKVILTKVAVRIPFWVILATALFCSISQHSSAQSCFSTYVQRDTVSMQVPLGGCAVSDVEILSQLGLQGCTHASLSVKKVGVNESRTAYVYNENTQAIEDIIVVKTTVVPNQVPAVIRLQFGTNDCFFTKDDLLDQLNVINDPAVRSNIHFISGTSRLRDFLYGDTIRIDRIVCGDGYTYAHDVKLIIEPSVARLQGNTITYNAGFTTQRISIEQILRSYSFFHYTCDISRFRIENIGPFGYGRHRIGDIYIDNALIAKDLEVIVNSGTCPTNLRDLVLDQGQCYLNKADILDTLGFDPRVDDYNRVQLVLAPGSSLENEILTVTSVLVDGYAVCTNNIFVRYQRQTAITDESTLACNDELNISLDAQCEVMLNSQVLLENGDYCYLNYELTAINAQGILVAQGHTIILNQAGTYKVTIRNPKTGANCESTINIEDKYIYDVTCAPDTVECHYGLEPNDSIGPAFPYVGIASTYVATSIPGSYIVQNNMSCAIKYASYKDEEYLKCVGDYKEILRRVWTFSDIAGNVDTCHQLLYVLKTPLDSVDLFVPFRANCISDFIKFDDNGYPSPVETGYPTISGGKYPAGICHSLKMNYTDHPFKLCGRSIKLVREWSIIDWCTDVTTRRAQTIYIEDKKAPELLDTLTDLHIEAHPFVCGADNVELPSPHYVDCGSDAVTIEVSYEVFANNVRTIVNNGTSLVIPSVRFEGAEDSFEVYYTLTDECGNVTYDTLRVHLADHQPPVAVCNQDISVSIAGGGQAQMRALSFDDLSVDNCGIAKYEARKVDGDCFVEKEFSELLLFCCEEVGKKIKVEFRVTDLSGNTNTCDVYVKVFDKFRPVISCPGPVTIDCGTDYDDFNITGYPKAIDNCSIDSLYYIDDVQLNDCGHGKIYRKWIARDRSDAPAECIQEITVQSTTPFNMTDANYPPDTAITGCLATIDPEYTGRPDISHAHGCSDVVITHEDTPFNDVNGACFKIIREWIVIDWCQYSTSSSSNRGKWVKSQAIKVNNEEAPIFIDMPKDTVLCSYGVTCESEVSFTATAKDDCSPDDQLDWYYELYRASDNTRLKTGVSARVTAFLAKGDYYIKYSVSDGCDNVSDTVINITIVDCRPPVVNCPNVVVSAILSADGTAALHLDDIALSAIDNCTASRDIAFSFDEKDQVTIKNFNCEDVSNGVSEDHIIKIYATDGDGNTAHCQVVVRVSDGPDDVCADQITAPTLDTLRVAGTILMDVSAPVDNVEVYITAPNGQRKHYTTSEDGRFSFSSLKRLSDYSLSFERNTMADEGLSVSDLVKIRRHILGLEPFESPYQVIAADITNDKRVSVADIAKLQRLLLLKDVDFDRGQRSWRFVRTDHDFEDLYFPFPYPEVITINDIRESHMQINMKAIKIGDVNGTNLSKLSKGARGRSHINAYQLTVDNLIVGEGQTLTIPVYSVEMLHLFGAQIDIHGEDIAWDIRPGALSLRDDDFIIDDGEVRIRWSDALPKEVAAGEPFFYITMENLGKKRLLSDILSLAPSIMVNDAMEEIPVQVSYNTTEIESDSDFVITKVAPVPFADYTHMHVSSELAQQAHLSLYDAQGHLISQSTHALVEGTNTLTITSSMLSGYTGMIMTKLSTGNRTQVRRIIRVN